MAATLLLEYWRNDEKEGMDAEGGGEVGEICSGGRGRDVE